MIKHKFKLMVGSKVVFDNEDTTYSAFREVEKEISRILWGKWRQSIGAQGAAVGKKGSLDLGTLSWECTWTGRAAKRAPDVIAAEKAAKALKGQARRLSREKYEKEAAQRLINVRKRIQRQIDHAFATGKSGTEPVEKYVTCEHCDAPAALLCLSQALGRGAAVLDEDTITGALCAQHGGIGYKIVAKVPCSKLEFFYDGIRQIAVKQ